LTRQHQLAPDHFRRDRRSTGAVDAHDHRADAGIDADLANPFGERVRTEHLPRGRIERAVAARDRADGVQQRDAAAARWARRGRQRAIVLALRDLLRALDGRRAIELIAIRELVDQSRLLRPVGEVRSAVDRAARGVLGQLASLGDRANELVVPVAVERLVHLAMRGREGALGEGVGRGLVVADVQHVRLHAQLVERAAEEQLVEREPRDVQLPRRHHHDAIGRGREVVLARAAGLEIRDERLAGRLEVLERGVNLLRLRPQRASRRRLDDERLDARVGLRAANGVDRRA
jgi:hypothetical protein